MTVISNALAFAGATGKISRGGKREYTAHYRVTTNDKLDQAFTIHEYFLAQGSLPHPDKATEYNYGNDSDSDAVCDSLEPRRDANSPYEWVVVAHFGDDQNPEKGEDEDENPTDDPLEFAAVITHRTKQTRRPVERAKYVEGFKAGTDALVNAFAQPTAIVNSAIVPYDPPLEIDYSTLLLSITKNVANPISGEQMLRAENAINLISFQVNHPSYILEVPAFHAKTNSIVPERRRTNGISYWRVTTEMEIDLENDWRPRILDRGLFARARAGDPDGFGGTISLTDINDGDPLVRAVIDKVTGQPISEPVLLNGDGQPLAEDEDPVFVTWNPYFEDVFQAHEWLFGILI